MSTTSYEELRNHIGHQIECVCYGKNHYQRKEHEGDSVVNIAVECETCGTVLLDFDKPEK